jgi:hypothetical protein
MIAKARKKQTSGPSANSNTTLQLVAPIAELATSSNKPPYIAKANKEDSLASVLPGTKRDVHNMSSESDQRSEKRLSNSNSSNFDDNTTASAHVSMMRRVCERKKRRRLQKLRDLFQCLWMSLM